MRSLPMTMYYCDNLDRWCIDTGDTPYWLNGEEGFDLYVGTLKLPCRIELGKYWYVIVNGVAFALMEGKRYMITLD